MFKFQCDEKQDTDCKASLCACDIEFVNTIRQFQHKFDKGQNQNVKICVNTLTEYLRVHCSKWIQSKRIVSNPANAKSTCQRTKSW